MPAIPNSDPLGTRVNCAESQSSRVTPMSFTSVEVCAGAGGQALGLHQAGFEHLALVEIEPTACETLRLNGQRLGWRDCVYEADLNAWVPDPDLGDVTLLSGGVPCPPFSIAGKQLGADDDRDLFPAIIRLARTLRPRVIQIENVRGLLGKKFGDYRGAVEAELADLGYATQWQLLNASDFGVPQLRPRAVLVAMSPDDMALFRWPEPLPTPPRTVGEALRDSMASAGWEGAHQWADRADQVAPTLVGGSKKHGGPDLGPTRARKAWAELGVNGISIGNEIPGPGFAGIPRLTAQQTAIIQGFPESWAFVGRKTAAYRQIGNAFPPPVAKAVGDSIVRALCLADKKRAAAAA